jgi:hypothetical protein
VSRLAVGLGPNWWSASTRPGTRCRSPHQRGGGRPSCAPAPARCRSPTARSTPWSRASCSSTSATSTTRSPRSPACSCPAAGSASSSTTRCSRRPNSGWIDDQFLDPPEQYWRIGPYLVEDETIEEVEKDVFIPFIHRPLSRYVNALAGNGLLLEQMVEPAPPPGFLARAEEYEAASTIPRLLYLRTRKVTGV